MHTNRFLLALTLALLISACAPVTSYTSAEAPKSLKLDSATNQIELHFAPGTASLSPADAARLRRLAAAGGIAPSDRVLVAAAGAPYLAQQRAASVAALLLHYGVVPIATRLSDVPPNRAIVEVTRTLVTLPACPNWSKRPYSDFDNQPTSNFGCATEVNLGLMVADPTDLASGMPAGGSAGQPASAAVNRYLNDKVVLPTANTELPIATQSSPGTPGTGTGTGSGTGTGTSGS